MGDLSSKKAIDQRKKQDDKEVKTETDRADKIEKDAEKVKQADDRTSLKGTDEGRKEIEDAVKRAMDKAKDTHKRVDDEIQNKFKDIKQVESNLIDRHKGMESDKKNIESAKKEMKSKDTGDARAMMDDAARKAHGDGSYLKESSDAEKKIREEGDRVMKEQKSRLKNLNLKKR